MLRSDEGFSAPLILILVLALVVVPAYLWTTRNQVNYSPEGVVQGVSTTNRPSKPGFSVVVKSVSPTWDLVEFLCTNLEDCLSSVNSGRRLGTISGGETLSHEVVIEYSPEWDNYKYIKYFVRSGGYTAEKAFNIESLGAIPDSAVHTIKDGPDYFEVVVAPTAALKDTFYTSATFTDL